MGNYGSCVDMWAPGSSVVSLSSSSDSGTKTLSGTSMACPHVAGGAALILGADNSKSPSKVISDLLDDSIRNTISGLQFGDTNALLYVGSGSACQDLEPGCGYWASQGFCSPSSVYYDYMQQNCCGSCSR